MRIKTKAIVLYIFIFALFIPLFCSCTGNNKETVEQSSTTTSISSQTPVSNISSESHIQSNINSIFSSSKYSSYSLISKIISSQNISSKNSFVSNTFSSKGSISIVQTNITIKVGLKGAIHIFTNPPNLPVTLISNNPKIVGVISWQGYIFVALSPGVCTVTAESNNGLQDTCQITVEPDTKENYVEITDLHLCNGDCNIHINHDFKYDYDINPYDASGQDKTTVVSSDPSIATVDMIFFGRVNIHGVSIGQCDIIFYNS